MNRGIEKSSFFFLTQRRSIRIEPDLPQHCFWHCMRNGCGFGHKSSKHILCRRITAVLSQSVYGPSTCSAAVMRMHVCSMLVGWLVESCHCFRRVSACHNQKPEWCVSRSSVDHGTARQTHTILKIQPHSPSSSVRRHSTSHPVMIRVRALARYPPRPLPRTCEMECTTRWSGPFVVFTDPPMFFSHTHYSFNKARARPG